MVSVRRALPGIPLCLAVLLLGACAAESPPDPVVTTGVATPASEPVSTQVPPTATTPSEPTATTPATSTSLPDPTSTTTLAGDPARGEALFNSLPCGSCHTVNQPYPGGEICPNLGNVASHAEEVIQSADYEGDAADAAAYIRESIVNPNAYLVPGENYRTADGQSVMPPNFGETLSDAEIDDLVAFLMQQRE